MHQVAMLVSPYQAPVPEQLVAPLPSAPPSWPHELLESSSFSCSVGEGVGLFVGVFVLLVGAFVGVRVGETGICWHLSLFAFFS